MFGLATSTCPFGVIDGAAVVVLNGAFHLRKIAQAGFVRVDQGADRSHHVAVVSPEILGDVAAGGGGHAVHELQNGRIDGRLGRRIGLSHEWPPRGAVC